MRDVQGLVDLASAFYGSATLFAALEHGLFAAVEKSGGLADLVRETGCDARGLRILADACVAEGLLEHRAGGYANTPAGRAALVPGGPADRDGRLKEGDRIIAVAQDGAEPVDVIDMKLSRVVNQIRGKSGTKVHLTILEEGSNTPKQITIVRDKVELKDAEAQSDVKTQPCGGEPAEGCEGVHEREFRVCIDTVEYPPEA